MTVQEQLHKSKTHRDGFDPNCPQCLRDDGISGIIEHLTKCAAQNEADARASGAFEPPLPVASVDRAVAAEQWRMLAILKLYRMVQGEAQQ